MCSFGDRPAPLTPLLLSIMIEVRSMCFPATSGARPRMPVCG